MSCFLKLLILPGTEGEAAGAKEAVEEEDGRDCWCGSGFQEEWIRRRFEDEEEGGASSSQPEKVKNNCF